jgi:hypothetical protein
MSDVYLLNSQGHSQPMPRIHCKNEDEELQRLLELNHNLLPGSQISPEDPRRWLLVSREMPVPDPGQDVDRWSLDFFFVDQDAMPTFVECKRYQDTRARREVVGQMLEYAANAQKYWSKDKLVELAVAAARQRGQSLDQALHGLRAESDTVDGFFDRVMTRLGEGEIRLVFFLDRVSPELASIVEFLNRQMERSEVLVVEARQYDLGQARIVVPMLYGYSEQARRINRVVSDTPAGSRRKWDEATFFDHAQAKLASDDVAVLRDVFAYAIKSSYGLNWGTGAKTGSFGLKLPEICPRALVTFRSDGWLSLNYGWLNGRPEVEALRDDLRRELVEVVGLPTADADNTAFPDVPLAMWRPKAETLLAALGRLARSNAANT